MDFFSFPYEIRLMIYSQILVRSDPIVLGRNYAYGSPSPPRRRFRREGLCPALLEVNKRVYREASPVLYSNNRFEFPGSYTFACVAPFLRKIGSQASLIHHICISFPSYSLCKTRFNEGYIIDLGLMRDTCTTITTLELSISLGHDFYYYIRTHNLIAARKELDLLDAHFKAFPTLKEIIANFQVHNEEDLDVDWIKIADRDWTVKITRIPKPISDTDLCLFEYRGDWEEYKNEQRLLGWKEEQESEDE